MLEGVFVIVISLPAASSSIKFRYCDAKSLPGLDASWVLFASYMLECIVARIELSRMSPSDPPGYSTVFPFPWRAASAAGSTIRRGFSIGNRVGSAVTVENSVVVCVAHV
jgi:hypothetical protein